MSVWAAHLHPLLHPCFWLSGHALTTACHHPSFHQFVWRAFMLVTVRSPKGGPLPMSRNPTRAPEEPRLVGGRGDEQGWSIFNVGPQSAGLLSSPCALWVLPWLLGNHSSPSCRPVSFSNSDADPVFLIVGRSLFQWVPHWWLCPKPLCWPSPETEFSHIADASWSHTLPGDHLPPQRLCIQRQQITPSIKRFPQRSSWHLEALQSQEWRPYPLNNNVKISVFICFKFSVDIAVWCMELKPCVITT